MTELEKMQRAKMYIDKLSNGTDPLTDTEISGDSVLNNARISRCLLYVSDILSRVIDNGGEIGRRYTAKTVKPIPFTVTRQQLSRVEVTETPVGISILAKRISEVLDENVKPVSAQLISAWLMNNGYLYEAVSSGKRRKLATAKGESAGIFTVDSVSKAGIPYKKNIFSDEAQRFIVENIMKIYEEMTE